MSVHFHIDRVVVDEWPGADREAIGEGLVSELTRAVRRHGLSVGAPEDGGAVSYVAGTFESPASPHADALGRQIAQAVYGGLAANFGATGRGR